MSGAPDAGGSGHAPGQGGDSGAGRPCDAAPDASGRRPRSTLAERFARLFPGERPILVDRAEAMATRFDVLPHQRPATCGAYALSYLLPAIGFPTHDGIDLGAEDYLAHLAAVVVESAEIPVSDEISRRVASGELTEFEAFDRFGRSWYRWPVRASDDPVVSGTSPTGVARAIALGSRGALATIPVPARTAGQAVQLTDERWRALLALLGAHAADWHWHAIFNYQTDRLLRPDDPTYLPANLQAPGVETRVPLDDWGVGHFTGLAALWRMGGDGPWWLLLMDTYKERGFAGYQPQPAALMRDGLVRDDGRGGGVLIVVPHEIAAAVGSAIAGLGLASAMWSNGSSEPDDWSWAPGA